MLSTDRLFGNNMVLQQNKTIKIWGEAKAFSTVEVFVQGKRAQATADVRGMWEAILPPLTASFEERIEIVSETETLIYQNVQVGDVWVAGGQFNMEFLMKYDFDFEMELLECEKQDIRFFDCPKVTYIEQLKERDYYENFGFWRKSTKNDLDVYSAVAYYFAKKLKQELHIPIGIIGCNWGGTHVAAWMSRTAIEKAGAKYILDDYNNLVKELDMSAYEARFNMIPDNFRTTPYANPMIEMLLYGASMEKFTEKLAEYGVDLASDNFEDIMPQMGPKSEQRPAGLYESMLLPITNYAVKGVLWYQGESDGDVCRENYDKLLNSMIEDWRNCFDDDLPFVVMQLPPFGTWMNNKGDNYISIRAAQQKVADTVEQVYLSSISDGGEKMNIHPRNKTIAGLRMALVAMNKIYGKDVPCDAPRLKTAQIDGNAIILEFEHAYGGLSLNNDVNLKEIQLWNHEEKIPFEISKTDIEGNIVYLHFKDDISEVTDVSIGYSGWYEMNLVNSADIPAVPEKVKCCFTGKK